MRGAVVLLSLVSLVARGQDSAPQAPAPEASAALARFLTAAWEEDLAVDPLLASAAGDPRYRDRLPDASPAGRARRIELLDSQLKRLRAVDRTRLTDRDRITYDIVERLKSDEREEFRFRADEADVTNHSGFAVGFAALPSETTFHSLDDYRAYVARLKAFGVFVDGRIATLREGMAHGVVVPRVVLQGWEPTVTTHSKGDPAESVFFVPCRAITIPIAEADKSRIAEDCRRAIAESVQPAYARLGAFLEHDYFPATRTTISASALPDGAAFYAHRVRQYTTLDVTPAQVHEIGLSEVSRIHAEMDAGMRSTGFTGTFPEFLAYLRTDPRFYPKSAEELLKACSWVLKRMDGQLPLLFRTLPRIPYGISPIPDYAAARATGAYYSEAPGDGSRAGMYFVNVSNLSSRPLYVVETLSFHEAVPGHHLQLSLQKELTNLPPLRRFGDFTAFVEGWALYAERLGKEVGFYTDPYQDFGRLTYESWRACRLVVDTGLHAFGWSRQRAIDYMAANTALSLHEIETEVDRYIANPGQALGYKMGEIRIRELRKKAEIALGARFDVRDFHDAVLRNGSVPLDILEREIDEYIHKAKGGL